jgi:hypothetical protein
MSLISGDEKRDRGLRDRWADVAAAGVGVALLLFGGRKRRIAILIGALAVLGIVLLRGGDGDAPAALDAPTEVLRGRAVRLTGTGFQANDPVAIELYRGRSGWRRVAIVTADGEGRLEARYRSRGPATELRLRARSGKELTSPIVVRVAERKGD